MGLPGKVYKCLILSAVIMTADHFTERAGLRHYGKLGTISAILNP